MRLWILGAAAAGMLGAEGIAFSADGKLAFLPGLKKSAPKPNPVAAVEPPALLPVPDGQPTVIQPVSQTQAVAAADSSQKSEVMKQLELLYQQDGREMPDLQVMQPVPQDNLSPAGSGSAKPLPATAGSAAPSAPPRSAPQNHLNPQQQRLTQPTPPTPPVAPAQTGSEKPPSKNPVTGFFRKLIPGKKDATASKAPAGYKSDVAPTPPGTLPRQEYAPAVTNRTNSSSGQSGSSASSGYSVKPFGQPAGTSTGSRSQSASAAGAAPALSERPLELSVQTIDVPPAPLGLELPAPGTIGGSSAPLPPLLSSPQAAQAAETGEAPKNEELVESSPQDNLENPFTEVSEKDADSALEGDPFTGLTLDEEASSPESSASEKAAQPQLAAPDQNATPKLDTAEDPFADELKKLGILPDGTTDSPASAEAPKVVQQQPELPSLDDIEDETTREKMKKIRERGGMKGLKGFCPVTLHDERELVDAKPDFHATYRGQKFHFASEEARLKFEEDPSVYAPAAYGADVVALTRDKDVVEGSLDHAAWFKGRLYLFGTQGAHDEFVANPVQYATPAGIE